jgi:ammonium transporter, Amt family
LTDPVQTDLVQQVAALTQATQTLEIASNRVWTLVCGFLVMFMQAGFALLEAGMCRKRNAAHVMAQNFLVYAIGILGFWTLGFGLQMGGVGPMPTFGGDATLSQEFTVTILGKSFGLFGTKGFFLTLEACTPAVATQFLFQMVFMDTACTIPTGALAERWKFASFVLFSLVLSMLIYPIYANWVWGGGWLASLGLNFGFGHGHVDFAGSSVVHLTGGVAALVGAKMLGPRVGKFNRDGSANPIPGHNIPMALLGTFILAFGWFGFNSGSTLAGTDARIAAIAVNTMLASAAGAAAAGLYVWGRFGTPDPTWLANGLLGGLVAITAPCAFVGAPESVLIGALAGVLVVVSALFVEQTLKIDDPVGATSVHGACGVWGLIATGLLANGTYGDGLNGVSGNVTGLFFGDPGQLIAELIGVFANVVYVGGMTALTLFGIGRWLGNRVSKEAELGGLDVPELGVLAYPDDVSGFAPAPLSAPTARAPVVAVRGV